MTLTAESPNDERNAPTEQSLNAGTTNAREMPMTHVFMLYLGVTVIVALVAVLASGSNSAFGIVLQYAALLFGVFLLCRFDRRLGEIRDELRRRG
jgi:Flp pilus assembly protein TadB